MILLASSLLIYSRLEVRDEGFVAKRIIDARNWSVNFYPELEAYVLIYSNQLVVYFMKTNTVSSEPWINPK
jgi:hypothetical protein